MRNDPDKSKSSWQAGMLRNAGTQMIAVAVAAAAAWAGWISVEMMNLHSAVARIEGMLAARQGLAAKADDLTATAHPHVKEPHP